MKKVLCLITLALAAVGGASAQSAAAAQVMRASATSVRAQDTPNTDVLPPQPPPYGLSYGEWSTKWWQWALAQPASANPMIDDSGRYCGVGQPGGPVWFLAGVWGGGRVSRTCSVPTDRSLFFPIVGAVNVHTRHDQLDTPEKLRADLLSSYLLPIKNLHASIDGRPVTNLNPETTPYRACAGGDPSCAPAFSVTLPTRDNVFGVNLVSYCPTSGSVSTCSPAVADGVYLMLTPFSAGQHTVSFRGEAHGSSQDVTYTITATATG